MMSLVRLFFLISIVTFMASCDDANAGEITGENTNPASEEASSWCGNVNKITFGLKSPSNVKFLIPEAYLFDPYNIYYKPTKSKDPIDFISVLLSKVDGTPNCLGKEIDQYTSVSLRAYNNMGFQKNLDSLKLGQDYDIGIERNQFHVFRNTQNIEALTRDILVPVSSPYDKTLYIQCSYGGAMIEKSRSDYSQERTGCHVYSKSRQDILVEYVLKAEDLNNYQKIDAIIQKTVSEFIFR